VSLLDFVCSFILYVLVGCRLGVLAKITRSEVASSIQEDCLGCICALSLDSDAPIDAYRTPTLLSSEGRAKNGVTRAKGATSRGRGATRAKPQRKKEKHSNTNLPDNSNRMQLK
jgi:hypothetical protein